MKKILIIIYILIFIALAYYVVTMFIRRDHTKVDTKQEIKIESSIEYSTKDSTENSAENDSADNEITNTIETTPENTAYDITTEDCTTECINIEIDSKKDYCLQVCGLMGTSNGESCNDLTKIERDYCLRNAAISEKNIEKCNDINDGGIKKQCENRLKEDLIDEMMQ
ncbi:MAG: hypothetical protein ACKUBY_00510 [Candidatus Moraniibacteriota bacterium]|jgi:uncharacterized protein YxeA